MTILPVDVSQFLNVKYRLTFGWFREDLLLLWVEKFNYLASYFRNFQDKKSPPTIS
jgi:hypothetical protein